jgi:ATP-binding cassette subfamily B protein
MYFDRQLWSFTRGHRAKLALGVFVGLAALAAGLARLALFGWLVALVLRGEAWQALILPAALALGAIALRAVLERLRARLAHESTAAVQLALRAALYDRVVALGPAHFSGVRTGDVTVTLIDGVTQLETFFGRYVPQLFVSALAPLLILAFGWWLDPAIALILLAAALAALGLPALLHWHESDAARARSLAHRAYAADFLDALQGLATLKAFGQSAAHARLLAERTWTLTRATMRVLAMSTATRGVTDASIAIGTALAFVVGASRVADGALPLSSLVVLLLVGTELFRPMRELRELLHAGMLGQAAAIGIKELLDAQPPVVDAGVPAGRPLAPRLAFAGVHFRYPDRAAPAHRGLDFAVEPGERLAIVGPSGAGKTSIVRLLLRFHDPEAGRVTLDGVDIRSLDLATLRRHFAVVSQDCYLFHGSVAENLRVAKPEASAEELRRAAAAANALGFIEALPHGFDTLIGERGVRLSGGQRQRLAIARALLRDTPILILDEALSSVDAENEALVQEAIDRLMRGRTTLVIAHRLSSIRTADRILVLEDGRAVETGTHAALMAAGGAYHALMAEQAAAMRDRLAIAPLAADTGAVAAADVPTGARARDDAQRREAEPAASPGWGVVLRDLLAWVAPLRLAFAGTLLLGLARVAAFIAVPVLGALVLRALVRGEDHGAYAWALCVVAPLAGLLHWFESWLAHDFAYRLLAQMRLALYRKLDALAPAYLLRRRSGDLVATATQDIETVEYFFAHTVAPACVAVLVPLVALGWIASAHWLVALALLPALAVAALHPFRARARVDALGAEARAAMGELNALTVDTVQGLGEVLAFQQERPRRTLFLAAVERYHARRMPLLGDLAAEQAFIDAMVGLGGLSIVLAGAALAAAGALPAAQIPLLALVGMAAFLPVSEIAQVSRQLADTYGATARLRAIHAETPAVADPAAPRTLPPGGAGTIALRDVRFAYPGSREEVLRGVDLDIEAGRTLALVGPSGAGKSTLAQLLLRFFDPMQGRIELDGIDLRELGLDALRRRIALVSQDTYLFNGTLAENIRLARPEASDVEVARAVDRAALGTFVAGLPDGLATRVGERGVQLSGGQRQRVAIARAFLKDADILVLDEATSHLDAASERQVHAALEALSRGRTTLVIAHRLSSLRSADRVAVLVEGRVAELGTHDALVDAGGIYARLVAHQLRGVAPAAP